MRTTIRTVAGDKTVPIPQPLLSIRSLSELQIALEFDLPWIDLKEPSRGSLGRPDKGVASSIYDEFLRRFADASERPCFSIALGELSESTDEELREYCSGFGREVYLKIALAGCDANSGWQDRVGNLFQSVSDPAHWILVHYADAEKANAPTWDDVLQASKTLGCQFILVDTWEKRGDSLLDIVSLDTLKHMSAHSHAMGLQIAMAGSLRRNQLPTLSGIGASFLGFRSDLCEGQCRTGAIGEGLVRQLLDAFNPLNESTHPRTESSHVIR